MTFYETLEVEPHASQREIKSAYRRLAKRYHPDLNPGDPESEEQFKEVVAAYEVLSDRRKRAAYDARVREPVSSGARTEWTRPERTTEEWKDLERDLRRWRASPPFDRRDAQLGALVSVSLTLAANASKEVAPFISVFAAACLAGVSCALPFRLTFRHVGAPVRALFTIIAPFAIAFGAMMGGSVAHGVAMPPLWGGSGIPFAFIGGIGGALIGGTIGRSFRLASEPVIAVVTGGTTGAFFGGGIGGFAWYWSSVFRWMEWPARDDLSELASAGVVYAVLGAAVAAARGGAREPANP